MDVLLVNPRYNGRAEIPPLGLEYIASPLLMEGIAVSILDLDVFTAEEANSALVEALEEAKPRIVGVTSLSNSFSSALEVCATAKCLNPDTLTVLGGMHATVLSNSILEGQKDVDVIVRGEGEKSFLDVVDKHSRAEHLKKINGISFRLGGRIVHNEDRSLEKDLDSLTLPAHHLIENRRYRTRSISSSRGCFHDCSFCSIQSQYHHRVRARSIASLIGEIEELVTLGAGRIMFTDDNFSFNFKRIRELCSRIIEMEFGENAEFYAEARIDDICRNPLMAQMMSDAGFRGLYIGAESGSARILDYYRKGIDPDDILKGVNFCVEQNLTPVVNFIILGPKDDIGTIRETISLAKKVFENGAEIAYVELLIPYPGTPIMESLIRDGKFREAQGVYYFESYEDIDLDQFVTYFNIARELTHRIHSNDKYYAMKKAYYELDNLDKLLGGMIPATR